LNNKGLKILYIVDGRSPIALNWISYFAGKNYRVHLVSTYACNPQMELASFQHVPIAFSGTSTGESLTTSSQKRVRKWLPVGVRTRVRQWIVPFTLTRAAERIQAIIDRIRPDLVHAMRIPYEGMLAAMADPKAPLLISVWGNDFTLHAPSNARMARMTEYALHRADALHADCRRDIRLAEVWGYRGTKASIVLPGGGGIQLKDFYPRSKPVAPVDAYTVINPRGMRAYVCNREFFQSIPRVLELVTETQFLCPAMAGEPQVQRWVDELNINDHVKLLPQQPHKRMAELFCQSQVVVSPSLHDGTPNTLLEAFASGCFPVVGDIESLREWITPGVNGMLVDPRDPNAIADGILVGLRDRKLRDQALEYNLHLVAQRADYQKVMPSAEKFYWQIVE